MLVPSSQDHLSLLGGLYKDHHLWLFRWLCKKLNCREDAADTAHETFFRLFSFTDLSSVQQPRALLVTTASRLMIDDARRKAVEKRYLEAFLESGAEDAVAPSPEKLAMITDTLFMVAQVLDGLPEKPRTAFLLSRLEGLRYAEIAERLDVSTASVKKYVATAMVHCCRVLGHTDDVFA
ncbi:sigma-70 family RNA polymerase sigma factor [Thalassolituus sp.]|uniref:sigma-70 family RNA polymerase sigma factor n=1 Tax=Thalassolituus sp. TaxID=2030822 RepID=UPI0035119E43